MKKIKFSVIIPVYNREKYLSEAIDSVIQQNYGIENIELILVDDGSTDKSSEICDEYAAIYPQQIKVLHQQNTGASSARNAGVKMATGDFLNFLDSDDKLSGNALTAVAKFVRKYRNQTDVISLPIYFFDEREGGHLLNNKFKQGTRIIDLSVEWDKIQMSLNSTFIRAVVAKKYAFDKNLHIATGEDTREVLRCLYEKQTLGVVCDTKYWYRKHSQYSLLGDAEEKKERYIDNLRYFHCSILEWYKEKMGNVPKFVQNSVFYDIKWRLKQNQISNDILDKHDLAEYKRLLKNIISQIDDEIILSHNNIYKEHKSYAFYLKYNRLPIVREGEDGKDYFCFPHSKIDAFCLDSMPVRLSFIKVEQDKMILEGFVFHYLFLTEQVGRYYVKIDEKIYDLKIQKEKQEYRLIGERVCEKYYYIVQFPIKQKEITKISFIFQYNDKQYELSHFIYEKFFPLDPKSTKSYWHKNDILLYKKEQFLIVKHKKTPCFFKECQYAVSLFVNHNKGAKKAIAVRLAYFLVRPFFTRPIWIIMDRLNKADDNGEVFFRYLQEQKHLRKEKVFFAIEKNSPDYERIKQMGPVVDPSSGIYKFLFLLSDYFISSQADENIVNPFKGYRYAYKSLNIPKFVFLQHGITMNDVSEWLNRFNKNMYGFITTTDQEREYIIDLFRYPKEKVWLTGMPRFDRLIDQKEKIISILPTWRKNLRPKKNQKNGRQRFLDSEYYSFYNSLMHNERFLNVAKELGYTIQFKLHPALLEYQDTFPCDNSVIILDKSVSYQEIYAKSSLIVTDYSSAVFDFAFLEKPVLYAQFDEESFFSGTHILKRGYFDYRENGFGEVETSLDALVDRLIEYMENDCRMKPFYKKRVEDFFAFHDERNCERIYNRLVSEEVI